MVDGYSRLGAFARMPPAGVPRHGGGRGLLRHPRGPRVPLRPRLRLGSAEKTVSVGVPTDLVLGDVFHWQALEAAALLVALPIAFCVQPLPERFISGFTMGAVKG